MASGLCVGSSRPWAIARSGAVARSYAASTVASCTTVPFGTVGSSCWFIKAGVSVLVTRKNFNTAPSSCASKKHESPGPSRKAFTTSAGIVRKLLEETASLGLGEAYHTAIIEAVRKHRS